MGDFFMRLSRRVAVLLVSATLLFSAMFSSAPSTAVSATPSPLVIIDAGHGGADGGAVSSNGVAEADINLSISGKAQLIARFLGIKTVMTRNDRDSLNYEPSDTIRQNIDGTFLFGLAITEFCSTPKRRFLRFGRYPVTLFH